MSYLVHSQIMQPSAVEAALAAQLTGDDACNLVVLRASGIDIYTVFWPAGEGKRGAAGDGAAGTGAKLILESTHTIAGTVRDAKAVRFPGAPRDSLLVSFSDAKLSIFEWNADRHELVTVSMHFYETDELKKGYSRFLVPPRIAVDPAMRCAGLVVLDRHLAILPFNDGGDALSSLYGWSAASAATRAAATTKTKESWLIPCAKLGVETLVDAVFLHDYFQPTLLLLYEDKPTWSGRACVTWNTRAVAAVSLDVAHKQWSVIWKVEGLGNDVHSAWAIPGPVGGAVLLGANAVYYINQTTRYCMAINIHGTVNPPFPKIAHLDAAVGVVLDAARLCVLQTTPRYAACLVSDKLGVLYALNLLVGGTSVDAMELVSIGASSVASCISLVPGGYVFLGSRVGDSLLLRCTDANANNKKHAPGQSSSSKRARGAPGGADDDALFAELFSGGTVKPEAAGSGGDGGGLEPMDIVVAEQDKEDLVEAAKEAQAEARAREDKMVAQEDASVRRASIMWDLSVADSLLGVPITSMILAPSMDAASQTNVHAARHPLDVVACSGTGRSGCIALLQRSARPEVFLEFDIKFAHAAWALYRGSTSPYHQYLVLARRNGTTVMSTATDDFFAMDASQCALALDSTTVGVWTLPGPDGAVHERILQCTKWEVRLCAGHEKLLQSIDCRLEGVSGWIRSASFAGGVLMVLRRNGQLAAWRYNAATDALVELAELENRSEDRWASCFVYVHPAADGHASWKSLSEEQLTLQGLAREMRREQGKSQQEIEEMLGGTLADMVAASQSNNVKEYVYAIVSRYSGSVEVWAVDMASNSVKSMFWCMGLVKGEVLVTHEPRWMPSSQDEDEVGGGRGGASAGGGAGGGGGGGGGGGLYVQEIGIYRTEDRGVPVLFCVTSQNDVYVYKSIHTAADDNMLPLRLRRVQVDFVTRSYNDAAAATAAPDAAAADSVLDDEQMQRDAEQELPYSRQLVVFNNVSGRRGVFFRGAYRSGWCFFSSREFPNSIVEHNMHGEGVGLNAFTPFHFQSCRRGFISVSATGTLTIAQLRIGKGADKNGEVAGSWIVRKVGLRSAEDQLEGYDVTPHAVDYHPPSQHFVVAAMAARQLHDDKVVGLRIAPLEQRWRASLYRAGSWAPSAHFWLDDGEQVLSLKVLSLSRGDDKGPERRDGQLIGTAHLPRKLYVVMGTGFLKNGEDTVGDPVTGNVRVFALVPTADPAHPYQLKVLIKEYVKGPVAQVAEMHGYLLFQVGPKTMMTLIGAAENVLVGKGFWDGQIYTTSLSTIKNFIMFTDAYKSLYLLMWREEVRQLRLLGKDYSQAKLVDGNFVVDYDALALVAFEEDGNLRVFKYDPGSIKTREGHQLVVTSEYNLGTPVAASVRVACHSLAPNPLYNQAFYRRNGVLAAGIDGSLHIIMPVHETDYRRMQHLQVQVCANVLHEGGLNPLEHRAYRSYYASTVNTTRNDDNNPVIDLALVYAFLALPASKRRNIARKIGTHQRFIFKNALEFEYSTCFF